jgi:uncharacterized membrane-anchored protein YitT (DUF2179 family)
MKKRALIDLITDILIATVAGIVVGTAYHIFQNSNNFAPGGVGGLATIMYHLFGDYISWSALMLIFNLPIMILLTIFINKKLGLLLSLYMIVQSSMPLLFDALGIQPYCLINNGEDFNVVFACIATGVISGFGFSLMLLRFGASGGTYGISALLKKARPEMNVAYVSFFMDASVVAIAFFVYGMKITPVICTLLNLFISTMIVDSRLSGGRAGYKFEIITNEPDILSRELIDKLHHGVTELRVHGMYSDTDKYMLVCIINKRQIGEMLRILKNHPKSFVSFYKVSEVLGNYNRKV